MFIEFQLPTGAAGMGAGAALQAIKREVEKWSKRYNIPYTCKTVRYTHRLCFEHDKLYGFFVMSWNPKGIDYLNQYVIVSDRNNRH